MRRDDLRPRALTDFEGAWQLSRDVIHDGGLPARFEGRALWTRAGDGLDYVETGTLEIAGQGRFAAERRYRWGPDLRVYFDDGRFFHQVPTQGGSTGHWCDPDQYDVVYDFSAWPRFSAEWVVRGPRKSYRMTSDYRR